MLHAAACILPIMVWSLVYVGGEGEETPCQIGIKAATGSSYQSEKPGSSRREDQKTLGQDWNIQHILYIAIGILSIIV